MISTSINGKVQELTREFPIYENES